jgi:hypothetical protein
MAKISKTQKKRRAPRASGVTKKPASSRAEQKNELSGYLVIWRHTMDDVPVGLFKTRAAATRAAKSISRRASYGAAKRLDIDCATPICYVVIAFKDGKPVDMTHVTRTDDI